MEWPGNKEENFLCIVCSSQITRAHIKEMGQDSYKFFTLCVNEHKQPSNKSSPHLPNLSVQSLNLLK